MRTQLRQRLLEAAGAQSPTEFGRTCRRLLAELDHAAAMRAEDRRYARRRASLTQTEDGMVRLVAELSGLAGETVATAVDAFTRFDGPDDHRSAEQRRADGLVQLCEVALRAGQAPARHGVRPQVLITLPADAIRRRAGAAHSVWSGSLPYGEVARLLGDASLARLLVDADELPLTCSAGVRSANAGLWRALVVRDGGCIAEGCDAPPGWCQNMHLQVAARDGGRLELSNSALGCPRHHREFDRGQLQLVWRHGRPILRRYARPASHPPPRGHSGDPPRRREPAVPPGLSAESRGPYDTGPPPPRHAPRHLARRSPRSPPAVTCGPSWSAPAC